MDKPKIDSKEVLQLWAIDYYDGELSGFCLIASLPYYFSLVDEGVFVWDEKIQKKNEKESASWRRRFEITTLSEADFSTITSFQDNFIGINGGHFDYRAELFENGQLDGKYLPKITNIHSRITGKLAPSEDFYEKLVESLSAGGSVAWFEY